MKTLFDVIPVSLSQALGWTLLHFTWQGAVLGLSYAVFLRLPGGGSAARRYQAGVLALVAMLACAVLTFTHQYQPRSPAPGPGATGVVADAGGPGAASPAPSAALTPPATGDVPTRLLPPARVLAPYLPQVVFAWLACVLLLGVRLTGSLLYVQQLRTSRTRLLAPEWQTKINRLARQLAVSRPVRLLESARVNVPVTIGCLKPIILLPAGLASGLSPEHLEAILVHELAHIARRDYLVNLFQSVLEILFFFHPAVWWVSAHVRREREYCCDDVAIRAGQDPLCYLEALTALETRGGGHALSLAFTGPRTSLLERVARLLGRPAPQPVVSYPLLLVAWVALGLALFAACTRMEPLTPVPGARPAPGAAYDSLATEYAAYDRLDDSIAVREQEKAALYFNIAHANPPATGAEREALEAALARSMDEIYRLKQRRDTLLPKRLADRMQAKQTPPPLPSAADPGQPFSGDVFEVIREHLVRDGLIRDGEAYTFRFSYRTMYVNGKRQPQQVLDKYKEIARQYGVEKNGPEDLHISKE